MSTFRRWAIIGCLSFAACGPSEQTVEYSIDGSGYLGLTISYQSASGMVAESTPKLPWSKKVTLQTNDRARLRVTCSTQYAFDFSPTPSETDECFLRGGGISVSGQMVKSEYRAFGMDKLDLDTPL
jgi:hypothetical protein